MLLEKFVEIAERGAERPLFLWYEDYKVLAMEIVPELEVVEKSIEEGTETSKNIKGLITALRSSTPNEFVLVKQLMYVSSLFAGEGQMGPEEQELVDRYLSAVKKFYHLAQTAEHFTESRNRLKEKLTPEEQEAYDLKLFQHEGMMYCLDFYLTMYKAIQDSPSEAGKRKYLESTDVNLGSGQVPSLWADFNQDESLTKFIYSILDDELRTKLTEAYFSAKLIIMKIRLNCDKQGKCEAVYQGVTLAQVISAFQRFILALIEVFVLKGIERLSSVFLKPYGDQPLLSEVKKQIMESN
ncbi:MAG TPA: hypothetical protein VJH75_03845 [Patescibacteria group bacterium]|nr:hypothetical protein [Patescibacteria group bacterium]